MKRFQAAVLAVTVVLVACGGGNICDSSEKAQKTLTEKLAPCTADGGASVTISVGFNTYDRATCDAKRSACTGEDLQKIDEFGKCLEGSPACTKDNLFGTVIFVGLCGASSQKISNACKTAIGLPTDGGN